MRAKTVSLDHHAVTAAAGAGTMEYERHIHSTAVQGLRSLLKVHKFVWNT